MKFVIFGLTLSSSWGNGHATLWRALCRALIRRKHSVVFFEHDTPYYAAHRDMAELSGGKLIVYSDWESIRSLAISELANADMALATSYCVDAIPASEAMFSACKGIRAFYDLDTPVTLEQLNSRTPVFYLPAGGLADFDLVLSYTGGDALEQLKTMLHARRVAPLYGSVDPEAHFPISSLSVSTDLSYLGTYAQDRQDALNLLFIEAARRLSEKRFVIGGAQYPQNFPWTDNIYFIRHVPPSDHPSFFCSSRLTLNVTRRAMAEMGYCPSGRLFEAAACGVPLLTDDWEGLDNFYKRGVEILVARSTEDVINAVNMSDVELKRIANAARERTLSEHTADHRAHELERLCA